jgi:hypothetical protein
MQALKDMGIEPAGALKEIAKANPSAPSKDLLDNVISTYREQSCGWKARNLFERQWMARDFRKQTGYSIDEMDNALSAIREDLAKGTAADGWSATLRSLRKYYLHQGELLKGYEKDPKKVEEALRTIGSWVSDIEALTGIFV